MATFTSRNHSADILVNFATRDLSHPTSISSFSALSSDHNPVGLEIELFSYPSTHGLVTTNFPAPTLLPGEIKTSGSKIEIAENLDTAVFRLTGEIDSTVEKISQSRALPEHFLLSIRERN